MTTNFGQLGLPKDIVGSLARRGITVPFPIQAAAIPDALSGRDVCGKAPTGSGKTLAFGLALLSRVDRGRQSCPRALVLVPTRELAEQILRELAPLARVAKRRIAAIYGGVGYGRQKSDLRRGVDVIVATPGRLEDLTAQRWVDLTEVDMAVIDEADRMADMGFLPAVRRILDGTSRTRQTLLFSATLDGDIAVLSREYQQDPVRHEVPSLAPSGDAATHHFWTVRPNDRIGHTADLITGEGPSIVFTRTRHGADRLARQLGRLGVAAVALHGGRTQAQRTRALGSFSLGRVPALIATDVAARGIHVDQVATVIHFDPPADAKDYVHRSGRTGRAGAGGKVVTLVTEAERRRVRAMVNKLDIDARFEPPQSRSVARDPDESTQHASSASPRRSRSHRAASTLGEPGGSVYVANLPWRVTSDGLRALFSPYGVVHKSTVITDRKTGRSRGFGFVDMSRPEAAAAIRELDGSTLYGRSLTVRPARPAQVGR